MAQGDRDRADIEAGRVAAERAGYYSWPAARLEYPFPHETDFKTRELRWILGWQRANEEGKHRYDVEAEPSGLEFRK